MKWISVKERSPDIYYPNRVLVVVKNPNWSYVVTAAYFDAYEDESDDFPFTQVAHFELEDVGMIDLPAEVTHWMPLPDPPEGEKDED